MSTTSRIKQIANNEGITITALEKKIGASKGVLSRAVNKNTDIQSKWVSLVVENYPQYNARWILTGNGSMLNDNLNELNMIKELSAENAILKKELSDTKEKLSLRSSGYNRYAAEP